MDTNTQPTLVDRCRMWIAKNVPTYSRNEYEALLLTNEALAVRLISKCMDFDALLEAHHRLQRDVAETMPSAPFTASAHLDYDVMRMERTFTVDFGVDRFRSRVAVADAESFTRRLQADSIRNALRSHFEREVSPRLWAMAERSLMKASHQ